jgi:hypothetical protein
MSGKNEPNKKNKKAPPKDDTISIFGEHFRNLSTTQAEFLSVYLESNTGVKAACFEKVGIARSTFHNWMKNNGDFKKCFEIAEKVCEDAKYEFCISTLYQMVVKGNDALVMGEIIKNAPMPAAAKIKALEIILKTTRAGKLALSPNIPEQQEEKPQTKSLDDILEGFVLQQPHSRGIEAFDQKEAKKDEGQ